MCPKCRLELKSFEGKFRCDNCGSVFIQVNYSTPALEHTRGERKKQVAMKEKIELKEVG